MSRSIGMFFIASMYTYNGVFAILLVFESDGINVLVGDRYLKSLVIPDPEVTVVPRTRDDECLILASDGLWDEMSNEEACDGARRVLQLWYRNNTAPPPSERGKSVDPASQAAAEALTQRALQKGSRDNISVVVLDLKRQRKGRSRP